MKKLILISIILSTYSTNVYSKELNTDSFFNEFNMRSIRSSMGQQLKFWCGSYPSEFFTIKEKNNSSITLVRNDDQIWTVTFLENNKIELIDQITSGSYLIEEVLELKYINDMNEWWFIDAANLAKLEIPEGEDCEKQ